MRSVFSVQLTEPFRGAGVGDLAAIIPRRAGDVHSHRSHGPLTSKREAVTSLDYARSKEGRNFPIRNPYIGVFIPTYTSLYTTIYAEPVNHIDDTADETKKHKLSTRPAPRFFVFLHFSLSDHY